MNLRFSGKTVLFLIALLVATGLRAQDPAPVKWTVSVENRGGNDYRIRFDASIESPWHIYDTGPYEGGPNATAFVFEPAEGVRLQGGIRQLTDPHKEFDPVFDMEIGYFASKAAFAQDIRVEKRGKIALQATVEWMACNDESCLPPEEKTFDIEIDATQSAPSDSGAENRDAPAADHRTPAAEGNEAAPDDTQVFLTSSPATPAEGSSEGSSDGPSLWSAIIEAILWGLAALLTPCVFPMIPMTVSFFLKQGSNPARGRFMALLYGLSIVALYTLPIGLVVLITRLAGGEAVTADIFNYLATHWLPNVIFFLVFMLFAASFFGAFDITLPHRLISRSDSRADRGGLTGIFFMALTLVLVSFSCTGPIVGSVLIQSTSGEIWAPVVTMFAFSLAFALPFTFFALFPSVLNRLPKSGGWLNSVKVVLGFVELALGLKFLSVADQTYHWGILDREVYLALWIAIFALLGLYLIGKIRFRHDSEVTTLGVGRLALSILTFAFVVYLLPGMWGAPLRALSGYLPPLHTQDFVLTTSQETVSGSRRHEAAFPEVKYGDLLRLPHGLQGFFDFDEALDYARKAGKPLFVDYTGHGCVNCREMEQRVWSDPRVLRLLREDFVIVALYSDDKTTLPENEWVTTESGKVLKSIGKINAHLAHERFGINSQPYYLILDDSGRPLLPGRGYDLDTDAFLDFLETGIRNYEAARTTDTDVIE